MSHAPSPWPALDEAFLEASSATLGFRLGHPQPLAITADQGVLFRRTGIRDRRADLYLLLPGGEARRLTSAEELLAGSEETLSAAERARRERTRTMTAGIVDIDLSEDGSRILVPLGERVFVYERTSGKAHEVELGAGTPFDMHLSPDGKHVSFVRDGDVWLADADGKAAPRRLTQHPQGIDYGLAEFVAQEEFDRQRGYFWSPDSRSIAFQRTDARRVTTVYVSDPAHPERAPDEFKYPRPGADNAIVDLGIVAVSGGQPRWVRWDLERYPYLVNVEWPKRGPLCLTLMNRAQTELSLLAVDAASGSTRELLHVTDPAWINRPAGAPAWLEDGSGFLWLSEGEPGDAIELRDAQGALVRTIQPASFGTRAIAGIEPDAAIVLGSVDPREQHVFRVPLSGGPPSALTSGGGVHSALAEHGVVVISSALREGGSSVSVIDAAGRRHELPSVAERPTLVPTTQLESVELAGREHYAAITRPRNLQAGKRYPVLLKVYGGPGAQMVLDYRDGYLLDQWYADAGFIVVRTDNRGSPNHGHDWERAILKDLISVPLADQVAALGNLFDRHPELDRTRVGIFGWSFGGYLSTLALLLRPDVFQAAVAGAPVTDWELYDTAYTERYMKLPADNPDGYRHDSALTHAAKLERPLLLMHGVTDDNVHFAHSLALIDALYRAGKRAEVVALSSTHMLADPKLNFAREKIQVDFFREKLGHE
jgi:dipeptidyl-peptidase-4